MKTEVKLERIPKTFPDWREARRFRAWELHEQGWAQVRIAEALGVSEGAVSQWLKAVREGGLPALRSSLSKRGPRARLSASERARLPELLQRGAEAYGFRGAVWTQGRVRAVIKQEFGVVYSERQVGRILAQIGWSRQKPLTRADQRDEAEVTQWVAETFPTLQKKSPANSARCSS